MSLHLHRAEISIHTFLAEGDGQVCLQYSLTNLNFNPHLPRGRWPATRRTELKPLTISIHTFLAEGDRILIDGFGTLDIISIHTFLAEGDRITYAGHRSSNAFQSTPSSRKVTGIRVDDKNFLCWFQSTPSSRKVTEEQLIETENYTQFQSTPSSRKVTKKFDFCLMLIRHFNPHLPRGRWRLDLLCTNFVRHISIHTFLAEGDTCVLCVCVGA